MTEIFSAAPLWPNFKRIGDDIGDDEIAINMATHSVLRRMLKDLVSRFVFCQKIQEF